MENIENNEQLEYDTKYIIDGSTFYIKRVFNSTEETLLENLIQLLINDQELINKNEEE